jgi:hypothetical protein
MNVNVFINWALYSIYGMMADADALRRQYSDAIDEVADELARRHPVTPAPLYRGVLLDGAAPVLRPEPNLTFLSWSEDRDVARWFGSPESYISGPFAEHYPEARGYVLALFRPTTRVLWHHSWRRAFGMPLDRLALVHPLIGPDGARQIAWSLDTQREVIIAPPAIETLPRPEPTESFDGATVEELDRRLSPPWIT